MHIGANDLTNEVDTITNLQTIVNRVKRKSPSTKVAISSVFIRYDGVGLDHQVDELNENIRVFCNENLIDYICNKNIDKTCLGKGQLHPNKKGKSIFATNLIKYIESTN